MSSITIPASNQQREHIRSFNIIRDLSKVADLIELCFYNTMDNDGIRYIQQMRRASQDRGFLQRAAATFETASMPLAGYVWEEQDEIVGNASLVPFRKDGRRIYLVANIAVHPDYRRRGIAHALTERAMMHARVRKANSIWLHVRDDNSGAIDLYKQLGFVERFRRTTWQADKERSLSEVDSEYEIMKRHSRFWPQQRLWLEQAYPDAMSWYREPNWQILAPGIWNWMYRIFVDFNLLQWAICRKNQLLAVASWFPGHTPNDPVWVASPLDVDQQALTALLQHLRWNIPYRRDLYIDYPADLAGAAFLAAGFNFLRTLIWMQAPGATS
ncbi:MAG: GNAT family N-acetyltransferase [Anaerolineales bacterium]|nr:GNAT family N-acetyltransferase [Anaerolineales bacterium]